jgi:hypothetical protein
MAQTHTYRISPEVWVGEREAYIFRCRGGALGTISTFCVHRYTLKELRPDCGLAEAFDCFRAPIYQAAVELMETDDPAEQHAVSAEAIRDRLRGGVIAPYFCRAGKG